MTTLNCCITPSSFFLKLLTFPMHALCNTALTRNEVGSRVRSLQLKKVASDACVNYCSTEIVDNPACSLTFCSNACVSNTNCTAFCIRQPASIGLPCTCDLQSIPGNQFSDDLLRAEIGASYWIAYT